MAAAASLCSSLGSSLHLLLNQDNRLVRSGRLHDFQRRRQKRKTGAAAAALVEASPAPILPRGGVASSSESGSGDGVSVMGRGKGDRFAVAKGKNKGPMQEDLQAEARAMARAANATVYSPGLLAQNYGARPLKVGYAPSLGPFLCSRISSPIPSLAKSFCFCSTSLQYRK